MFSKKNVEFTQAMNAIFKKLSEANPKNFNTLRLKFIQGVLNGKAPLQSYTQYLENIYDTPKYHFTANFRALLAANLLHGLFTSILEEGLPLTDPSLQKCIKWAKAIIDFPEPNHPLPPTIRADAYGWLAGIYIRRGVTQCENQNIPPDSNNSLIRKGLGYLAKEAQIKTNLLELSYQDTSEIQNGLTVNTLQYLPQNATLRDEAIKQAIAALEQAIAFYKNVPLNKRRMVKLSGTDLFLLKSNPALKDKYAAEITAAEEAIKERKSPPFIWDLKQTHDAETHYKTVLIDLATLYATRPMAPGKNPDYERAVYFFEKTGNPLEMLATKANCDISTLNLAKKNLDAKLSTTVNEVHRKLVALTLKYTEKKSSKNSGKHRVFNTLYNALSLNNIDASKATPKELQDNTLRAIEAFRTELESPEILKTLKEHRGSKLARYIANALSILTILPAIVRAASNQAKYGTCRFWKPKSEKVAYCAQATIDKQFDRMMHFRKK